MTQNLAFQMSICIRGKTFSIRTCVSREISGSNFSIPCGNGKLFIKLHDDVFTRKVVRLCQRVRFHPLSCVSKHASSRV